MLFTNVQLGDFRPTLARLLERLTIENPQMREWIMMAISDASAAATPEVSPAFKTAQQLTFATLSHALAHPEHHQPQCHFGRLRPRA